MKYWCAFLSMHSTTNVWHGGTRVPPATSCLFHIAHSPPRLELTYSTSGANHYLFPCQPPRHYGRGQPASSHLNDLLWRDDMDGSHGGWSRRQEYITYVHKFGSFLPERNSLMTCKHAISARKVPVPKKVSRLNRLHLATVSEFFEYFIPNIWALLKPQSINTINWGGVNMELYSAQAMRSYMAADRRLLMGLLLVNLMVAEFKNVPLVGYVSCISIFSAVYM